MVRPPKVTPVTPGWFRILRSSPSRNGIEHHWIHVAVWIYDTLHGTYNIFICILSSYNYLTFILCFLKYRNRLYVSICCMQIIIYIYMLPVVFFESYHKPLYQANYFELLLQAFYSQLRCREDLWFPKHVERFAPLWRSSSGAGNGCKRFKVARVPRIVMLLVQILDIMF